VTSLCAWCDQPAIAEIEVEGTRFRVKTIRDPQTGDLRHGRELIQRAITAPVCPAHFDITNRGAPPRPSPRARKPGPEQTTVFDFLDPA
jgi:hypothetical protein